MPLLTESQLERIIEMIMEDYGSRLSSDEVSEVIGLILEDIPGFEMANAQTLDQTINSIRSRYYDSASQNPTNR